MENQPASMLLIADSHVQPATEREDEFFNLLDWIATTDCDVLFLGDNLDLWIASGDRYEADVHRRFLAWCEREKTRRRVNALTALLGRRLAGRFSQLLLLLHSL